MKKNPFYILAVILIFTVCSCSSGSEEGFDLGYNELNTDSGIDLNGYECVIWQSYDLEHPFQYPRDTLPADLYLKRLDDISNDWNCRISLKGGSGYLQESIPYVYGNMHVAEIACTHVPTDMVMAGILYPLDGLQDYIDYFNSDKFGSLGMLEMGMLDGVPYTVSPVAWPGKQSSYNYNLFAVNEDLIAKYAKTDPRDYIENGEWTWDTFENSLRDYQIDDGSVQATALNVTWTFLDQVAYMNGAKLVTEDSSGYPQPSLDSVNIAEAIDWCSRLFTQQKDCISYLGHYDMVDAFINGHIILAQTSFTHMINEIIYDIDNYGVAPFPCGPRGTYGEWRGTFDGFDSVGIFINSYEPESAAMIIDRMFEPFEGFETHEDIERYAYNIFYDRRDVELFTTYLKYIEWNYWTVGGRSFFDTAKDMAMRGKSSAEAIEKYRDKTEYTIEKYILPNYDFIKQYQSRS